MQQIRRTSTSTRTSPGKSSTRNDPSHLKTQRFIVCSCANKSCGSSSGCAAKSKQTSLSTCSETDAKQLTRSKRWAFLNDQFRFRNTCKYHLIVDLLFGNWKTQSAAGGRGIRGHSMPAGQHPMVPHPVRYKLSCAHHSEVEARSRHLKSRSTHIGVDLPRRPPRTFAM